MCVNRFKIAVEVERRSLRRRQNFCEDSLDQIAPPALIIVRNALTERDTGGDCAHADRNARSRRIASRFPNRTVLATCTVMFTHRTGKKINVPTASNRNDFQHVSIGTQSEIKLDQYRRR